MNDGDRLRLLSFLADSLERQAQPESAMLVRWAHRRIVEGPTFEGGCEACGAPLEQRGTGRPRQFCSNRCRRWKYGGKPTVVS